MKATSFKVRSEEEYFLCGSGKGRREEEKRGREKKRV